MLEDFKRPAIFRDGRTNISPAIEFDRELLEKSIKTIVKGGGIIFVGSILNKILDRIFRILIARFWTASDFGLINLGLSSMIIVLTPVTFAWDVALAKYIPYYKEKKDFSRLCSVIRLGIGYTVVGSLLVSLILYISAPLINSIISSDGRLSEILRLFSIILPFAAILQVALGGIRGFKRMGQIVFINNLNTAVRIFTLLSLIIFGAYEAVNVCYSYLAGYSVAMFIAIFYIRNYIPYSFQRIGVAKDHKGLLSFMWPLVTANFLGVAEIHLPLLILGHFLLSDDVGLYAAALTIASLLRIVRISINPILMPIISEFHSKNLSNETRKMYGGIARISFLVLFPLFLFILLHANLIMSGLFGPEYGKAALVLQILSIGEFVHILTGPFGQTVIAMGKTRYVMLTGFIHTLTTVVLTVVLVPYFQLLGAALAVTIATILSCCIIILYFLRNIFGTLHFFNSKYPKILCSGLLSFLVIDQILRNILRISGYTGVLSRLFMSSLLYILFLYILHGFGFEEAIIWKFIRSKILNHIAIRKL